MFNDLLSRPRPILTGTVQYANRGCFGDEAATRRATLIVGGVTTMFRSATTQWIDPSLAEDATPGPAFLSAFLAHRLMLQ